MEFNMKKIRPGMLVEGKVFMVTDDSVHLDLGSHAEGVIYKNWLTIEDINSCKDVVKEGDVLSAKVSKIDDENQQVLLSRKDILFEEQRKEFDVFVKTADKFEAKVTKAIRGGLLLDSKGVEMFMPISHIAFEKVNPEDFIGKTLEVTLLDNERGKLKVSRKNVLGKERKIARKAEFETFKIGDKLSGKVVRLMDFGAFVEIGQNQGLIHRSEISHYRTDKVEDILSEGQTVETVIISKDKGKIGLSMKKLQETPWQIFANEHKVGDEVIGKITRKMGNSMLVEVAKEVVGIINEKDYSWDPRTNLAGEVQVDSEITLKILSLDAKKRRMSLSKKHLEYNPWKDVTVRVGEEVSGTVEELQSNGALVKIQGVKAFLPIGEIRDERVQDIAQVLKVNDVINAIVTQVERNSWRMSISIKQLKEGKQRKEFEDYLKTEEKVSNPTLGDLFKDKLEKFKK